MKKIAKFRAESLRKQGKSIKEIGRLVGVSQSTASRWCSDIALSSGQRKNLERRRREAGMKALAPWIRRNRSLKKKDMKEQGKLGRKDVDLLTKRDLFVFGLGLYCGEGYKRGSQEWGLTNSDSKIILATLVWLREQYAISIDRIIARLTINMRYKTQAERLTAMWSNETGIPIQQFGKPSFISGYNGSKLSARTYRGTLRIKVRRGISLRRRILASIAEIENQITLNSRKTAS